MDKIARIHGVLLVGGLSSRMGRAKHLLERPDGMNFLIYALGLLRASLPTGSEVCISVKDQKQESELALDSRSDICVLRDEDLFKSYPAYRNIGPACGLLSPHHHDKMAHWLILACDYPLIVGDAFQQLKDEYEEPVTCFINEEGFPEPLIALWSPLALQKLEGNVQKCITGPSRTVKSVGGKTIRPRSSEWLRGTNTPEELSVAMKVLLDRVENCNTTNHRGVQGTVATSTQIAPD